MLKKFIIAVVILYVLFILVGVGLLYFERIEKFTFFPGYSIKHTIKKPGTPSTEGPIVLYHGNKKIAYSLLGTGTEVVVNRDTVTNDSVICHSFQTGDTFGVTLKEAAVIEPDTYPMPSKMLVISDIEGNFRGLKMILKGAGVINANFDWSFGNGDLVLPGDFFDRGDDVTACLWLIYRLEAQALAAGGKVHYILGNHEMMNLAGKLKYLNKRYPANAGKLGVAYPDWYGKNSELGRWLRSKNVIERIGDVLFLHAGISPGLAATNMDIAAINTIARTAIDKNRDDLTKMEELVSGPEGPFWYRGIATKEIAGQELEGMLAKYEVKKMVIGHTILGNIKTIYDGKVIVIDLQHQENSDKGNMQALWYDGNIFSVIHQDGRHEQL